MAHLESNRIRSTQQSTRPGLSGQFAARLPRSEEWVPLGAVVVVLSLWEVGSRIGMMSALFFPPPSAIIQTLIRLIIDGTLFLHLKASLGRLLLGVILGGLPGLLLGLSMGSSRWLRRVFEPFVAALHPLPKIALLPLIMVMFGIGEAPKVIVAATGAFFPMLITTMAGVRQLDRIYFEAARNYGAGTIKLVTRVVLPGSLPFMLSGLLLALNVTLLLTISVEMVSGRTGLGAMIWLAWETMRVEELYATLTVVTLFGVGFNVALHSLSAWLIPWKVEREP